MSFFLKKLGFSFFNETQRRWGIDYSQNFKQ
ncbi:predicted protein [Enterococcus faecalis T8]|nr:predicted protein [Enterococcus faecalis T8]